MINQINENHDSFDHGKKETMDPVRKAKILKSLDIK